jgi:hypothetical protein
MEKTMDANLIAQAEILRQTVERLARVGVMVDRSCLSSDQRRAIFALQRLAPNAVQQPQPRPRIGFAYPNAR